VEQVVAHPIASPQQLLALVGQKLQIEEEVVLHSVEDLPLLLALHSHVLLVLHHPLQLADVLACVHWLEDPLIHPFAGCCDRFLPFQGCLLAAGCVKLLVELVLPVGSYEKGVLVLEVDDIVLNFLSQLLLLFYHRLLDILARFGHPLHLRRLSLLPRALDYAHDGALGQVAVFDVL